VDSVDIAQRLVDALARPDGKPDLRPVHAIGIGVTGTFVASDVARDFCIAEHFQGGDVDVTARFSNGSGSAVQHDGWSDVRGMATRFHLKQGDPTDLIAMTLPEFFAPTPETFLDFAITAKPMPFANQSPWRKFVEMLNLRQPARNAYPGETIRPDEGAIRFADQHGYAQLGVFQAAAIGAPSSYVRAAYHAVHTFIVTAPDATRRWVRFTWQPTIGVKKYVPKDLPLDRYLQTELADRLTEGPARFSLMMAIGEAGDDFSDCTTPWPPHRPRIMMGTLTLKAVAEDQSTGCERLSFNPTHLTPGIEPSDDPVLHVRGDAYELSALRRGATTCPFGRS